MENQVETNLAILDAIKLSIQTFKEMTFLQVLMAVDAIPVDIPVETNVIAYINAMYEDTNQQTSARILKKLTKIIEEHEQRTTTGNS